MVSFSCDLCQNVAKKPKVLAHFQSCRTSSVSCIDCGVNFNRETVRQHTSCITEEAKYGPKQQQPTTNSQTFCASCGLHLNGAVAAHQHYESKKHRSTLRRKNAPSVLGTPPIVEPSARGAYKEAGSAGSGRGNDAAEADVVHWTANEENGVREGRAWTDAACGGDGVAKKRGGVKKAMKKILQGTRKKSLRLSVLEDMVREALGAGCIEDVADKVKKRALRYPFQTVAQGRRVALQR